jgi:hypothetical protein
MARSYTGSYGDPDLIRVVLSKWCGPKLAVDAHITATESV